jgi:hypothetical protein
MFSNEPQQSFQLSATDLSRFPGRHKRSSQRVGFGAHQGVDERAQAVWGYRLLKRGRDTPA